MLTSVYDNTDTDTSGNMYTVIGIAQLSLSAVLKMGSQGKPTIYRNSHTVTARKLQNCRWPIETMGNKFRPLHNETILALKYHKLSKQENENVDKWTDYELDSYPHG